MHICADSTVNPVNLLPSGAFYYRVVLGGEEELGGERMDWLVIERLP